MKKFRFFSIATAVVAALFVSVWAAGSTVLPLTTLDLFGNPIKALPQD